MNNYRHFIAISAVLLLASCSKEESTTPSANVPDESVAQSEPAAAAICASSKVDEVVSVEIVPGLNSKTLAVGCEPAIALGQVAVVHYTGWLYDESVENKRGTKFDSSRDRDQHFPFPLGAGRVIQGWDKGVVGMQIGEIRELTIAPALAYGESGRSVIPPNSTLVFEVELAGIE